MKLTYDPKQNVAYICFQDNPAQVETVCVTEELHVDLAPDGTVYGIELLNANAQLAGASPGELLVVNEVSGQSAHLKLGLGV